MSAYAVIESERKTLEIAVHPDGTVVVRAPVGCPHEVIEARLRLRSRWIETQQRFFRQFHPRTPSRQYLSGETHLYLGKRYRLKILVGPKPLVRLVAGQLIVEDSPIPTPTRVAGLLDLWYGQKAEALFHQVVDRFWTRHTWGEMRTQPLIRIRQMNTQWGSLSPSGILSLNPLLVRTPLECVEYVICHELCHLVHHSHGSAFLHLLDERMPDWKKRKHRLELALS